jgi:arylsulfatase A-like enzyme
MFHVKHFCPIGVQNLSPKTADTLVFYSTDNGPHMNSWPDAAMTPFRNEKNSNWEGAYRGQDDV